MNYLRWGIAGILCIVVPFAATYDPYDLWNPVIAGTAGGSLFLIMLLIARREQLRAGAERTIVTAAAILFIGGMAAQTSEQQRISSLQSNNLKVYRERIGIDIIVANDIQGTMLQILQAYHAQTGKERLGLGAFFRKTYGSAVENGTFNQSPKYPDVPDHMDIVTVVEPSTDTLIRYHCIDTVVTGRDAAFRNANGYIGRMEFIAVLTPHGVTYERRN